MLQWGELRAQKVHQVKGQNVLVPPYQKGKGPFVAKRRLDNYKLFISISMKRFT
jgi:hypothetical protein